MYNICICMYDTFICLYFEVLQHAVCMGIWRGFLDELFVCIYIHVFVCIIYAYV